MTVATKSNRTLQIDGMTGEDCCQKVAGALKGVSNVETHQVKVGSANIEADEAGSAAACRAIDGAGFKAHEGEGMNGRKQENSDAGRTGGSKPGQTETKSQARSEPKGEQKQAAGGTKPAAR